MNEPNAIFNLIASTATVAIESGARLFGWSNAGRPLYFRPDDPFKFTGPVGRALGTVSKDVLWDNDLITMCDTDVTLQELQVNRIVLLDTSFYWSCGSIYGNRGGMQDIRTNSLREADIARMKRKWGGAFAVEKRSKSGTSTNAVCVSRRQAFVD